MVGNKDRQALPNPNYILKFTQNPLGVVKNMTHTALSIKYMNNMLPTNVHEVYSNIPNQHLIYCVIWRWAYKILFQPFKLVVIFLNSNVIRY
jgi:hypothetical protein